MCSIPCPLDASPAVSAAQPVPFATTYVTLTKQAHIELVMQANSWKSQHRRAVERAEWRDQRYQRVLRQVKTATRGRRQFARAGSVQPPPSTLYSVTRFCICKACTCTVACCAANSARCASSTSR